MLKKKLISLVIILSFLLTGCSSAVELTEDENNIIAEYISAMVLKYDKNYHTSFIPKDITEPEPTTVPASSPQVQVPEEPLDSGIPASGLKTPQPYIQINELFKASDFEIVYNHFDLYDSYPENVSANEISVSAYEGYKLLVAEFDIKNLSSKTKQYNLLSKNIDYRLQINGSDTFGPLLTIIENDLRSYNQKIVSGASKPAVLIYRIPDDLTVRSAELYISEGDKTAYLSLK